MKNLVLIFGLITNLFYSQRKDSNILSTKETIGFTYDGKLIILKGKINGIDANILWDNGFSYTAVDENFAKKLNLPKDNSQFKGVDFNGNNSTLTKVFTKSLQIADKIVSNLKVLETNTAMFPTTSKIDAILGADIINQFYWDFNFDKKEITVSKKK